MEKLKYIKDTITVCNLDCMEVLKKLPNNYIDLIVTDPPYPTTKRGGGKNQTTGGMLKSELSNKGKMFKHNDIKPVTYIPELYRVLKEGSHCYIMTNHINLQEILNTATASGFHFIKSLIWVKDNKIMGQCYMSQFEYILFFRKGKHKKINNCGTSDVLNFPNKKLKDEHGANYHPTEKPVEMMKVLIENSSNEGDLVFDPFCGIGSVALASQDLGRKFGGCELDPKYFDTIVKRLNGEI